MQNEERLKTLRETPVKKALIKLAVPSILTSLVGTIYNIVDTFFISQLHNTAMIAATTVALPITMIIQSVGDGIGAGSSSYVGRCLGSKDYSKTSKAVKTAMTMTIFTSLALIFLSLMNLNGILNFFSSEQEVIDYAYQYMFILVLGSFFAVLKQILSFLLRSEGDVQFPMVAILIGIFANMILDPIFMFEWGLNLQVKGAALATVFSQIISAVLMMVRICTKSQFVRWKFLDFGFDFESFKEILNLGIVVFIRSGLPSISYGMLAKSAGLFSTATVAAVGLAKKSMSFAMFVFLGLAQGYQPFASYNYGAKNKKRLLSALKISICFTMGYGFVMSFVFYFFGNSLMQIYTQELEVIAVGQSMMKGYACCMPILGVYEILAQNFQSLGKSKKSFLVSISRQGLFYIPFAYILPRLIGEIGIYITQPLTDWCTIILVLILSVDVFNEIKNMPDENAVA